MLRLLPFLLVFSLVAITPSGSFHKSADNGIALNKIFQSLIEGNPISEATMSNKKKGKRTNELQKRNKKRKFKKNAKKMKKGYRNKKNRRHRRTKEKKTRKKLKHKRKKQKNKNKNKEEKKRKVFNKTKKKKRNTKKVERQNDLDSQTCIQDIARAINFETGFLNSIVKQINRILRFKALIDNKKKKTDDFNNTRDSLHKALGNDKSCSNKKMYKTLDLTARATSEANDSYTTLNECRKKIKDSCTPDYFHEGDLTSCLEIQKLFTAYNQRCINMETETVDQQCNCWHNASKRVDDIINGKRCGQPNKPNTSYITTYHDDMKNARNNCIQVFSDCKKKEDASIKILSDCLDGVEDTKTTVEGTNEFQINKYNPRKGVLTLEVPKHPGYEDNIVVQLIPENGEVKRVVSSNGTCLLSSSTIYIPDAKKGLAGDNIKERIEYTIQLKQSMLNDKERNESNINIQQTCSKSAIFKTDDKNVSETEFDNFSKLIKNGELIGEDEVGENEVGVLQELLFPEIQSLQTRSNRCGRVVKPIPTYPKGCARVCVSISGTTECTSVHEITQGGLKIECCLRTCTTCKAIIPSVCDCEDAVKHKSLLSDCIIAKRILVSGQAGDDGSYKTPDNDADRPCALDGNGDEVKLTMEYKPIPRCGGPTTPITTCPNNPMAAENSRTRAVIFRTDTSDPEIMMHSAFNGKWKDQDNNFWIRSNAAFTTCRILDLPNDKYPLDLAANFHLHEKNALLCKNTDLNAKKVYLECATIADLNTLIALNVHKAVKNFCNGGDIIEKCHVLTEEQALPKTKTLIGPIFWPFATIKREDFYYVT